MFSTEHRTTVGVNQQKRKQSGEQEYLMVLIFNLIFIPLSSIHVDYFPLSYPRNDPI
jgi:hypothetical protein